MECLEHFLTLYGVPDTYTLPPSIVPKWRGLRELVPQHELNTMDLPTPATHAILAQLKAGETVHQAGELPKHSESLKYTPNHLKQCVRHLLPRFSRLQWKMVTGQAKGGAEPKTQAEQTAQLEEILGRTDANKAVKDLGTVTEMRF